jgi:formylglycine-generating enzyme required for sulfatase activity
MGTPKVLPNPWEGAPAERPGHEVTISAFDISEEPVTLYQLCEVLSHSGVTNIDFVHPSTRAQLKRQDSGFHLPLPGRENHPARMSWEGAQKFCALLSKKINKSCRLPTEAEWEFAAAGSEKRTYPWGELSIMRSDIFNHPLGANPDLATPNGIQDMNGPVTQWCLDTYEESFYATSPLFDPVCRTEATSHVVRGGSMMRYMDTLIFPATWKRFQATDSRSLNPSEFGVGCRVVISLN